jgi:hypothetical protein
VLIYVGSTGRWGLRMSQHEREQWWWPQVGNITFQDRATRQEAYVVEDIAIVRERPLHNKRRNFAQNVAADVADEAAYANASAIAFMAAIAYLLAKLAVRHMAYQVEARQARRPGPGAHCQPVPGGEPGRQDHGGGSGSIDPGRQEAAPGDDRDRQEAGTSLAAETLKFID